jgi:hypothetical protein
MSLRWHLLAILAAVLLLAAATLAQLSSYARGPLLPTTTTATEQRR